jgi:CheY-like chemotaxis protein
MRGSHFESMIQGLNILVADRNRFMRRLTRGMLMNLGARVVVEAVDGLAALEAIRTCDPDVMFLESDLPVLDGMEVIHIVRSPGVFPRPNLPIVMLTQRSERSCARIPAQADEPAGAARPLTSITLKPRAM